MTADTAWLHDAIYEAVRVHPLEHGGIADLSRRLCLPRTTLAPVLAGEKEPSIGTCRAIGKLLKWPTVRVLTAFGILDDTDDWTPDRKPLQTAYSRAEHFQNAEKLVACAGELVIRLNKGEQPIGVNWFEVQALASMAQVHATLAQIDTTTITEESS